jgi:arylsulfatase A
MQSGHGPFGTPIRFRNQTEAGNIGEMIMEADEIVGKIFDRLEANGIADDTLLMWMTDNGPASAAVDRKAATGHDQRRVDLPDKSVELKGFKNAQQEAGHRTPFLLFLRFIDSNLLLLVIKNGVLILCL